MKDSPLLVDGCPLCKIFKEKSISDKLYWPIKSDDIQNSEFIIIECQVYKVPQVIYRDHVTTITREAWGKILYKCKTLFGSDIMLKSKYKTVSDHYHCYVEHTNEVS
jgi:hypothetical protein